MTYYDHMIPEGSHKMIRLVRIHYYPSVITGFSFFDKDDSLIWEIGNTESEDCVFDTVMIDENEVIVGVVAKLCPGFQSLYSDLQFRVARV